MARVSDDDVRAYQGILADIEDAARSSFLDLIRGLNLLDPENRQRIIDCAVQTFGRHGDYAAEAGRSFYQFCRDKQTNGKGSYVAKPVMNEKLYGALTEQVKKTLDDLADGKTSQEEAEESLGETVADYSYKPARDTVFENMDAENDGRDTSGRPNARVSERRAVRRMKGPHIKYMRVPTSSCACAFCVMMAGRGAVYHTLASAGGGDPSNLYHHHCRCAVVPVSQNDPLIDGYDPSGYEQRYEEARDAYNSGEISQEVRDRIAKGKALAEKQDRKWRDFNEIEIVMRDMFDYH